MNQEQLNNLIKELNISVGQILREEAEMIFLNALAKDKLSAQMIFYGGTALRLVYGSPRFSEDIDLLQIKPINFKAFEKLIRQVVKNNKNWRLKDIKDKRQTLFALFMISDEKLKQNFSVKIEVHKPDKKVDLAPELLLIKSPTAVFEPLLLVPSLEKLKELKINAILGRKKARDVFDLWYISRLQKINFELPKKIFKHDRNEFKNELRIFLPKKYYPVIDQLYERLS